MTQQKLCPACEDEFSCGANSQSGECWCNEYPAVMPADPTQECLCPECLAKAINERIDERLESASVYEAIDIASEYRGGKKPVEGIDFTIEGGNTVFTRWFLLKRGHCCGNGCKHCPF